MVPTVSKPIPQPLYAKLANGPRLIVPEALWYWAAAESSPDTVPETFCVMVAVGAAEVTVMTVEPTGVGEPPSGLANVAISVALPTVRPLMTTPVVVVKGVVGLWIAAELSMAREIGIVLVLLSAVETVAVSVAVCPTMT